MLSRIFLTFPILFFFNSVNGAEDKGGMPQLNPDSFSSQIFWLTIFFVTLFIVIHFMFIPKLKRVRISRETKIDNYLSETKKINQKIEKIIADIEFNLKKTRNVLDDEIKLILDENKKNYEEKVRVIERDYEKKKKELNEKLLDSRNDLVKKVPEICVSLSDQLFEKIMNEKSKGSIKDFNEVTKEI
jgi:F-type H+-transporting ATPase subunit b